MVNASFNFFFTNKAKKLSQLVGEIPRTNDN